MSSTSLAPRLFCFGLGYSAQALAGALLAQNWRIAGTSRSDDEVAARAKQGIESYHFDRLPASALDGTTHLLCSVPPDEAGDPVLAKYRPALLQITGSLSWAGYLSTTGVYGDTGGGWVDETSPCAPSCARQARRIAAEQAWLSVLPVHLFRLAGIYGPGRSALDQVRAGRARRFDKPGHVFSRIHVDDISNVLIASMKAPNQGAIYHVCDDCPAEPAEVILEACRLLGKPPPPLLPFSTAELSPLAASFWRNNRRVSNLRIKRELKVRLRYPDFYAGLAACFKGSGA